MPRYIVTVKLPHNPDHDPDNKQTGNCPVSSQCTDVTGEHHSYLVETDDIARATAHHDHVTRIEQVD